MTLETQTESALSDYVKKFLLEFKDEKGNFRYVDDIDNMMPSKSKFINIDYNDLVLHPDIESVFNENPDSILEAFSRANRAASTDMIKKRWCRVGVFEANPFL